MKGVRSVLRATSRLVDDVEDGLAAVKKSHRGFIAEEIRESFADSLDLDEATKKGHEREHRWDYLLGHDETAKVVGLEPHSAYTNEVSTVIEKRKNAIDQLEHHLKPGARISDWFWVASGRVDFVPHDKQMMRLAKHGITFVGSKLLARHLKKK